MASRSPRPSSTTATSAATSHERALCFACSVPKDRAGKAPRLHADPLRAPFPFTRSDLAPVRVVRLSCSAPSVLSVHPDALLACCRYLYPVPLASALPAIFKLQTRTLPFSRSDPSVACAFSRPIRSPFLVQLRLTHTPLCLPLTPSCDTPPPSPLISCPVFSRSISRAGPSVNRESGAVAQFRVGRLASGLVWFN